MVVRNKPLGPVAVVVRNKPSGLVAEQTLGAGSGGGPERALGAGSGGGLRSRRRWLRALSRGRHLRWLTEAPRDLDHRRFRARISRTTVTGSGEWNRQSQSLQKLLAQVSRELGQPGEMFVEGL